MFCKSSSKSKILSYFPFTTISRLIHNTTIPEQDTPVNVKVKFDDDYYGMDEYFIVIVPFLSIGLRSWESSCVDDLFRSSEISLVWRLEKYLSVIPHLKFDFCYTYPIWENFCEIRARLKYSQSCTIPCSLFEICNRYDASERVYSYNIERNYVLKEQKSIQMQYFTLWMIQVYLISQEN